MPLSSEAPRETKKREELKDRGDISLVSGRDEPLSGLGECVDQRFSKCGSGPPEQGHNELPQSLI